MRTLIDKYLHKLQAQGLADREHAVFLALDAELVSNRPIESDVLTLSRVFDTMSINSLLFAEPAEPYRSIIREILRCGASCSTQGRIVPMDCETRTFFHDIPVVDAFEPEAIAAALSHRKAAIIRDRGIVTYGVVTPEQAFVSFSSTCFSTFVKYFYDVLMHLEQCRARVMPPDQEMLAGFDTVARLAEGLAVDDRGTELMSAPPEGDEGVIGMIAEAGRAVVDHRLVDSYFGNISYVHNNTIYISQTGSSLDELERCVDAVPLDGSSSVGITASSELSAHKNIHALTGASAILHGHPKFPVILSMHCLEEGCDRTLCHKSCKEQRSVAGVPVVSGEIGTGPTGLLHTVPAALGRSDAVIVYGHGVFTAGRGNFRHPFARLLEIERTCREEYFRRIGELRGR